MESPPLDGLREATMLEKDESRRDRDSVSRNVDSQRSLSSL
jgi:hypothetical protein